MAEIENRESYLLLSLVGGGLLASAIGPTDRFTWFLEALPVLLGIPLVISTHAAFPLTPLLSRLLVVHACILLLGAHYTYAQTPVGHWMQDLFHFTRNHYDRIGHFAQGFVPAILAREILLRRSPLQPGKWLFFLVCSVCLAFSASYGSLNGESHFQPAKQQLPSSVRRAMSGIRSGTCFWHSLDQ